MPFSIFRLRTSRRRHRRLLIGMSLFSMFFFISLYLQDVLGYSPIKTGIAYLPLAVGIIIAAGVAGQLVTRVGFKPPLIAGMLLVAGGLLWFSQVPATGRSFAADVLGPSLLAAFGLGFAFVPVTIAAVTEPTTRGGPGLRSDQHLPADRRRARARDPRDHRQQPHPKPVPRRRSQLGRGDDQRL